MPTLKRGNKVIEKTPSIKFLGVMLDENVSWKSHMETFENKLSKNIGLLCRAKQFLDETFSYIHSFLNYANIAWASTHFTKLKTISYKHKQAARILFDEDRLCHSRPLLRRLNALNVYQINLFHHLDFLHRLSMDNLPKNFNNTFKKPERKYPTKFSICNYRLKKHSLKSSKFGVSYRGPKLCNEFLSNEEKKIECQILFQKRVKSKLLDMENELSYFLNTLF